MLIQYVIQPYMHLALLDLKCSNSEPTQILLTDQFHCEFPKLSHLSLYWPVLATTLLY